MAQFMSIPPSPDTLQYGHGHQVEVLTLIGVALVANPKVMVAFVGYHQFIRPLNDIAEFKFIPPRPLPENKPARSPKPCS